MADRTFSVPIVQRTHLHRENVAITDNSGSYSYSELVRAAESVASNLLEDADDLREQRIAFLIPPSFEYVAVQWGIWLAGGVAVPLCLSHPLPELQYVLEDTGASLLVGRAERVAGFRNGAGVPPVRTTEQVMGAGKRPLPRLDTGRRAMILYTSGTTSRPKGVVSTHNNVRAQIESLVDAWQWQASDRILEFLPLHHTHGIINVVGCALWSGARCDMMETFDAVAVWKQIVAGDLTLVMAVPTIYGRLIAYWREQSEERRRFLSQGCEKLRLMVSGSAALPVSVLEEWREISSHTLLERYGMTEIGMALANPLLGERRAGSVGFPLPGVTIRLVDEAGAVVENHDAPGEIQVRGETVFEEYWQRPDATRESFVDGWFRTGDLAVRDGDGYYRILGRNSVDIIKTGGYKVSALEIEEVLLTHDCIGECAVVGVADPEWGERVCCAVVCRQNTSLELSVLRTWAKRRLATYKVPSRLAVVPALPRNALGKVTKPQVKKLFDEES